MSLRVIFGRYKRLLYGPRESLREVGARLSGRRASLMQDSRQCQSDKDHWAFALRHLHPCQKPEEILGFIAWARAQAPTVIVEIGVARSGTSYLLTQCLPSLRYYLGIDYFPMNTGLLRDLARPDQAIEHLRGDSNKEQVAEATRHRLKGRLVDLLFIDGNHAYAAVKRDWELYRPLVKPGGWVVFHDIQPALRTANGGYVNDIEIEVHRLWEEIKALSVTREFVADRSQHCYGIGVWQQPKEKLV